VAGLIVGALLGVAVGSALAGSLSETERLIGGVVVGAFVGAALGGPRNWLIVLGCLIGGYFVGSEVGKHSLQINEFGLALRLEPMDLARLGFGIVGAIVGAVLAARVGGRRREAGGRWASDAKSAILHTGSNDHAGPVAVTPPLRKVPSK
jgi:hypothetical protein